MNELFIIFEAFFHKALRVLFADGGIVPKDDGVFWQIAGKIAVHLTKRRQNGVLLGTSDVESRHQFGIKSPFVIAFFDFGQRLFSLGFRQSVFGDGKHPQHVFRLATSLGGDVQIVDALDFVIKKVQTIGRVRRRRKDVDNLAASGDLSFGIDLRQSLVAHIDQPLGKRFGIHGIPFLKHDGGFRELFRSLDLFEQRFRRGDNHHIVTEKQMHQHIHALIGDVSADRVGKIGVGRFRRIIKDVFRIGFDEFFGNAESVPVRRRQIKHGFS